MIYTENYTKDHPMSLSKTVGLALKKVKPGQSVYIIFGEKYTPLSAFMQEASWNELAGELFEHKKYLVDGRYLRSSIRGKDLHPQKGDIIIDAYTMDILPHLSEYKENDIIILPWKEAEAQSLKSQYPIFSESI